MRHKTFVFKGKKINYQDEGRGKNTLVLLHGYMNSLEVWQYFVLEYMNNMRVIAVDLIGHGDSETIDEVSTMELQAEMIKELLDSLDVKQCVMCGHSMGGMITLAFMEKYPEMLKGYCLMNSQAMADSEKGKQNRLRAIEIIDKNRMKFIVDFIPNLFMETNRQRFGSEIDNLKEIALNTPVEGIIAAQKGMICRRDRRDILQKSTCPVLFIIGKEDTRADLDILFAQIKLPMYSEVMLLNSGHMSFIEEELKVKIRLKDFVNMCFAI